MRTQNMVFTLQPSHDATFRDDAIWRTCTIKPINRRWVDHSRLPYSWWYYRNNMIIDKSINGWFFWESNNRFLPDDVLWTDDQYSREEAVSTSSSYLMVLLPNLNSYQYEYLGWFMSLTERCFMKNKLEDISAYQECIEIHRIIRISFKH